MNFSNRLMAGKMTFTTDIKNACLLSSRKYLEKFKSIIKSLKAQTNINNIHDVDDVGKTYFVH